MVAGASENFRQGFRQWNLDLEEEERRARKDRLLAGIVPAHHKEKGIQSQGFIVFSCTIPGRKLSRSEAEGSIPLHVYVPSLGHQILDSDVKLCFRVLN